MSDPIFQDNDGINAIFIHSAIDDAGLDPFSFRVLMHLSRRANKSSMAFPGLESIANVTKISERQVRRAMEVLEARKMVEISQAPGKGNRHQYLLTAKSRWILEPDSQAGFDSESESGQAGRFKPDCQSGSFTREGNPIEGNPKEKGEVFKKAVEPLIPEPFQAKTKEPKPAKAAKKNHVDPTKFLPDFPVEFKHDDAFVEAWKNWGEMRNAMKKPLTPQAAKLAMNRLTAHPVTVGIQALERSTLSGWTGVFPESVGKGPNGGKYQAASETQPTQDFGF